MKKAIALFWRIYYGRERVAQAEKFARLLKDSARPVLGIRSHTGEAIRGWWKPSERVNKKEPEEPEHPLLLKYGRA